MTEFKNKTALVTGASIGIGREIAIKLAQAGSDLILVARTENALNALAKELQTQFGTNCLVITSDLSKADCAKNIHDLVQANNLQVDILINNAGFGTYGPFETIPPQAEQDEIAVNVSALVALTHAFIPGMLAKGSGAVLNIASVASFQPGPFFAVYCATKAFVLSFSEALWVEYRQRGVHVAALCPPAVETAFFDRLGQKIDLKKPAFAKPITAEYVAQCAMNALRSKAPTHIIGLKNKLMANSVRFTPRSVVAKISGLILKPSHIKA
jgi:short-subunit dehydrogenase